MKRFLFYLIFYLYTVVETITSNVNNGTSKGIDIPPRFQSSSIKAEEMSQLMTQHKQKIETQETALEMASETVGDISRKLHDMEEFIRAIQTLQDSQSDNFDNFVKDARLLDEQMQYELAEKDARIAQLEYRIRKLHRADPYVEKYQYPIYKFWVAVDTSWSKSDWGFDTAKASGKDPEIYQNAALYSSDLPSTLLILKSHELSDGFVYSDVLLAGDALAVTGNAAAGVIFFFSNSKNFWMAGLSKYFGKGLLSVSKVSDGILSRIAEAPMNVESETYYRLACRFSSTFISVFVDGMLQLEVDLSSAPSTVLGSAGLFTLAGKAKFQNFVSGSPLFENLAPEGAFEVILKSGDTITRKVTDEEELRRLKRKESPRFMQLAAGFDNQAVDPVTLIGWKDYEDTDAKGRVEFFPNSPIHVPDEEPLPLIPEDLYRQAVVEKPALLVPAPQVALCEPYSKQNLDINDWLGADTSEWEVVTDFGMQRFTISSGIQEGKASQTLLLKNNLCNREYIKVNIRLEDKSGGGVVFRATNKANNYMAIFNTKIKAVQLLRQKDGKIEVLQSAAKYDLAAQLRRKLTVIDHGAENNGLIVVLIDNQPVISINDPYQGYGQSGIVLQTGHGVFDSFELKA